MDRPFSFAEGKTIPFLASSFFLFGLGRCFGLGGLRCQIQFDCIHGGDDVGRDVNGGGRRDDGFLAQDDGQSLFFAVGIEHFIELGVNESHNALLLTVHGVLQFTHGSLVGTHGCFVLVCLHGLVCGFGFLLERCADFLEVGHGCSCGLVVLECGGFVHDADSDLVRLLVAADEKSEAQQGGAQQGDDPFIFRISISFLVCVTLY